MKIKNIKGTSVLTCPCGSWLKHWENFSNQSINSCPVNDCSETDLVGAHVQEGGDSTDDAWYICPLCSAHNKDPEELEVSPSCKLVPANKSDTCEKKQQNLFTRPIK
jgi:hypothetical protein